MKGFTIYTTNCTGNAKNCIYLTMVEVKDIASLERAMRRDHVCAMYHDHKRSAAGFERSDCIPMDCDNDHSEDPEQWKQPEDVVAVFPDVTFAVCYSRNHMKEKNGHAARPKFHCYFPINKVTDSKAYTTMKHQIQKQFPWFDANALDAARFYFGTEQPEVMFFVGDKTVDQVLPTAITAGIRKATLSQKAGKLIKRYGGTAKAEQLFKIEAECAGRLCRRMSWQASGAAPRSLVNGLQIGMIISQRNNLTHRQKSWQQCDQRVTADTRGRISVPAVCLQINTKTSYAVCRSAKAGTATRMACGAPTSVTSKRWNIVRSWQTPCSYTHYPYRMSRSGRSFSSIVASGKLAEYAIPFSVTHRAFTPSQ